MRDKYLITGATGFIGANLTRRLVEAGNDVSIITRNKKLNFRLKDIEKKIKIHEGDILDSKILSILKKIKPHYIFHLASYGVYLDQKDTNIIIDANLRGTINLLSAAKKVGFKLFIHTGSCFEYGNNFSPIKEIDILNPTSDYGIIKAASTLWCQKEAITNKLPIIILRLSTAYGYYDDPKRLISSVILSALKNKSIEVSSPKNVRNFTFIDDLVEAYILAAKTKIKPGEIFNIASKKPSTVGEVVDKIVKITSTKSKVLWLGRKKEHWTFESKNWDVDISKAKNILGFTPKYDLDLGLFKTVDWFKQHSGFYS